MFRQLFILPYSYFHSNKNTEVKSIENDQDNNINMNSMIYNINQKWNKSKMTINYNSNIDFNKFKCKLCEWFSKVFLI